MADEQRNNRVVDLRKRDEIDVENHQYQTADYLEETSAEMAAPVSIGRGYEEDRETNTETGGNGIGFAAIILSILSLFVSPVLFGAAGIVLGFVARRKGAQGLGSWAIGIGAVSIVLGMFILPFF